MPVPADDITALPAAEEITTDDGNTTSFSGQELALSCGEWVADDDGVRHIIKKGKGISYIWASTIPVMPLALLYNADTQSEKVTIGFKKLNQWRKLTVPRSAIGSPRKILDLADKGLEVTSINALPLISYLSSCITNNFDKLPTYQVVSHFGWVGNDFVPYSNKYLIDEDICTRDSLSALANKGTLDGWINTVRPLLSNTCLRLLVMTSFATPLIEKLNALPFFVVLWGKTGTCKTVTAMVAASVWGDPTKGKLVKTLNMTSNSLLSLAALLRNIPLFGDELEILRHKLKDFESTIMTLTGGVERGRLDKNARQRETPSWYNSFIVTGEAPCVTAQSGGGAINRIINIEASSSLVPDGNEVANAIVQNYGLAGEAFVKRLDVTAIKRQFRELQKELLKLDTTDKQASSMALILAAGNSALSMFFPDLQPLTVQDVAGFLSSTKEVDTASRAYDSVCNLIAVNNEKFLSSAVGSSEHHFAIWGRMTPEEVDTGVAKHMENVVYFNRLILEAEMAKLGFSFDAVKRSWAAAGYLLRTADGKYAWPSSVDGVKSYYVKLLTNIGADTDMVL